VGLPSPPLPLRSVSRQARKVNRRSLRSGRDDKVGVGLDLSICCRGEKLQIPPLRSAPVGMTKGKGGGLLRAGVGPRLFLNHYPILLPSTAPCHPDRSEAEGRDLRFTLSEESTVIPPWSVRTLGFVALDVLRNLNNPLRRRHRTLPAMGLEIAIHELRFRMWRGRRLQPRIQLHG
jgi:hypothetical protein